MSALISFVAAALAFPSMTQPGLIVKTPPDYAAAFTNNFLPPCK